MGRPANPEKEWEDNQLRQATFRIEHGKLTAFHEKCKKMGSSATEVLTAYIDQVIAGDALPEVGRGDAQAIAKMRSELESLLDGKVTAAIANLNQPDPTDATELIKKQVKEAIAQLPKSDHADLESIKLDCQALARGEIRRALAELPQPEPVDIEGQISAAVSKAIATMSPPDPKKLDLQQLAWEVVELLTDDQKKQ